MAKKDDAGAGEAVNTGSVIMLSGSELEDLNALPPNDLGHRVAALEAFSAAVHDKLIAYLNEILPQMVADLMGGDAKAIATSDQAEVQRKAELAQENAERKKEAEMAAKQERDRQKAVADRRAKMAKLHAADFAEGVPTCGLSEMLEAIADGKPAIIRLSNTSTYAHDYKIDATGLLRNDAVAGGVTLDAPLAPPAQVEAFEPKFAVLVIDGVAKALCHLGDGLRMGEGREIGLPAGSLVFRANA